jgi:hypothetical protein
MCVPCARNNNGTYNLNGGNNMDTRLSSSYQYLLVSLHEYYKHISNCEMCIENHKKGFFNNDNVCGDAPYYKGEVIAAEQVYLQKCEVILNIKMAVPK